MKKHQMKKHPYIQGIFICLDCGMKSKNKNINNDCIITTSSRQILTRLKRQKTVSENYFGFHQINTFIK